MSPLPMMSTSTSSSTTSGPELMKGVLAESYRVVSAHSRHFLALSVLFLLPLSSLLISSPSLLLLLLLSSHFSPNSSSTPPRSLLCFSSSPHFHLSFLLLLVSFLFLVSLLFLLLSAFSSLAHSVRCGFFGRPVKLLPALSSLPSSLPRLLLTLLPISTPLLLLSSPLLLALRFLPHSPLLIFPLSFFSALPLLYLAVSWSLSLPIAILDSSYGLHPLRRSAHLVRGMRPVAIFLYLLFAPGIVLIVWQCGLGEVQAFAGWREALPVVARTVFGLALTAVLLLYWMVSSVVMYLYCKAVHGELAAEIAEEFAWEYVCLPFDKEKAPHVVSVVQQ